MRSIETNIDWIVYGNFYMVYFKMYIKESVPLVKKFKPEFLTKIHFEVL